MTNNHKTIIAKEMFRLAGDGRKSKGIFKYSQVELANRLGISNASVSNMIAGKWTSISEAMWRKVENTLRIDIEWNTAETANFVALTELLETAQADQLTVGISYDAGVGKSHSYKEYERYKKNVIYVECKKYWTVKTYVKSLLNAAGLKAEGTTEGMLIEFTEHVMGLEDPIIIIDQMDKLREGAFDLFMDIWNDLFRCSAFVVSGVPALKKRILRGAKNDKIGYRELHSRLHKSFLELNTIDLDDVRAVCLANGLTDEEEILLINNRCEGDLRVVRKDIKKYFILNKKVA